MPSMRIRPPQGSMIQRQCSCLNPSCRTSPPGSVGGMMMQQRVESVVVPVPYCAHLSPPLMEKNMSWSTRSSSGLYRTCTSSATMLP